MYYRRYFAGTIASNTVYKTITGVGGGTIYNYYNQTNVLLSAIKQTLEDVGIQCECREAEAILVIDGVTVQVGCYQSAGGIKISITGKSITDYNGAGYIPFSNTNYRFYVTLKGDIDGILQIYIGAYGAPQQEANGIEIGKGVDLRDGMEIRMVNAGGVTNISNFFVLKNDRILDDYNTVVTFGLQLANVSGLNNNGAEVTLVECVAQPGRFKLNNCYLGNAVLAVNNFYNIGGDIYYALSNYILVKCADTQVS